MNGTQVYSNTKDTLNMPEPFNAYLEVETSDAKQMLWASYSDYYDTLSNVVTVQSVPAGDIAEIVSGSTVLATATNTGFSAATLSLNIAKYNMPVAGTLEVLSGSTVVAMSCATGFWGGDTWLFSPTSTTSSSSSSSTSGNCSSSSSSSSHSSSSSFFRWNLSADGQSQNTLGNAITGYYTALYNSAGTTTIGTGFTPSVYTLNNGVGYQIEADSYGPARLATGLAAA